jgi:hypothetical protein
MQAPKPKPDPFADVYFGKYHALVIGNNRYRTRTKDQRPRITKH